MRSDRFEVLMCSENLIDSKKNTQLFLANIIFDFNLKMVNLENSKLVLVNAFEKLWVSNEERAFLETKSAFCWQKDMLRQGVCAVPLLWGEYHQIPPFH